MTSLEKPDHRAHEALSLPTVASPYQGRLRASDHFAISAFWFATNFLWGALLVIMLPGEIKALFPEYRVPALGYLFGFGAVVALVAPLVVGALSDRCASPWGRRRPYIATGVAINVLGLACMWAAFNFLPVVHGPKDASAGAVIGTLFGSPTFLLMLGAYMIAQLGNNIATAAYSGFIPDLVPEDQRGIASGWMALMSQVGTLLGAVGCGLLLSGQPEVFKYGLVMTVLVLVALVTLFRTRENPLPVKPPPLPWKPYLKSLWINPKQYPDFAWVWITRAFVMLGFYSVLPFINYYLIDIIPGVDEKNVDRVASMLIAIILVASSVSGIYGGALSDRIGRKRVVYYANSVIAVVTLGFVFCGALWQVMALGVLFGLGFGAYTSVDWALGTDVLPSQKDAAKEMAVWHIAMTLPQSIAAPFAGFFIALFGMKVVQTPEREIVHYTQLGYGFTFLLCAILFALGAYFLRFVRGVK